MASSTMTSHNTLMGLTAASIVAVMTFLFGIVFLLDDRPVDEGGSAVVDDASVGDWIVTATEWAAIEYPTGVPTVEGFRPTTPGRGLPLEFRNGNRIHLPDDVHHSGTKLTCEGGCPPLPIYTLWRGEDTISVDGNGEIVFMDIDTDNPEAFPFMWED